MSRPARLQDVHALAAAMPHVSIVEGPRGNTMAGIARTASGTSQ